MQWKKISRQRHSVLQPIPRTAQRYGKGLQPAQVSNGQGDQTLQLPFVSMNCCDVQIYVGTTPCRAQTERTDTHKLCWLVLPNAYFGTPHALWIGKRAHKSPPSLALPAATAVVSRQHQLAKIDVPNGNVKTISMYFSFFLLLVNGVRRFLVVCKADFIFMFCSASHQGT